MKVVYLFIINHLIEKMLLKKLTCAILIASAGFVFSCSSKETRDAYDKYYGSGSTERVEAALAKDSADAANRPKEITIAASSGPARKSVPADVEKLLNENICFSCHRPYEKLIGPSYYDVAQKNYSIDRIVALVHSPEPENWPGYPPMAPMPQVAKDDVVKIATWINSLKD